MNIPKIKRIPNMINSMVRGVKSNDVAHAKSPELAPEKARSALNVAEPKIIRKAITVTRKAPAVAFTIAFQLRVRKMTHKSRIPKQPKAADSEGVAIPYIIKKITPMMTDNIGKTSPANSINLRDKGGKSTS